MPMNRRPASRHSEIEMTLNTYAHVNHGMQKGAAAMLDQMFG
jgi:hypothetical protein